MLEARGLIDQLKCVFLDIAQVSVEQCEERYKELKKTHETRRYRDPLFTPEFITADCSKVMKMNWIFSFI